MATVVDNTSIASAQERAASILYGNEKPISPVTDEYKPTATAVIAEYSVPVTERRPEKPTLSGYYHVSTAREDARPRSTELRSYEPMPEPLTSGEPHVIRPIVDPETIAAAAPVAVAQQQVKSEIDIELEENTQYVVRFKTSTIVAAAALATIFFLMAVLFVVNIVSLSSSAATLNRLQQAESSLNQELDQAIRNNEQAKNDVLNGLDIDNPSLYDDLEMQPINPETVDFYQPTVMNSGTGGGFFDWICKMLSRLFS